MGPEVDGRGGAGRSWGCGLGVGAGSRLGGPGLCPGAELGGKGASGRQSPLYVPGLAWAGGSSWLSLHPGAPVSRVWVRCAPRLLPGPLEREQGDCAPTEQGLVHRPPGGRAEQWSQNWGAEKGTGQGRRAAASMNSPHPAGTNAPPAPSSPPHTERRLSACVLGGRPVTRPEALDGSPATLTEAGGGKQGR